MEDLKAYKAEYGDCLVPSTFKANQLLGTWVKTQRTQYRKFQDDEKTSYMTQERIQILEKLGFVWVVDVRAQKQSERNARLPKLGKKQRKHDQNWNARLEDLKAYKAEYGDCLVPEIFKD